MHRRCGCCKGGRLKDDFRMGDNSTSTDRVPRMFHIEITSSPCWCRHGPGVQLEIDPNCGIYINGSCLSIYCINKDRCKRLYYHSVGWFLWRLRSHKYICNYCCINYAMACWRCTKHICKTVIESRFQKFLTSDTSDDSCRSDETRKRSRLAKSQRSCVISPDLNASMTPDLDTHDT